MDQASAGELVDEETNIETEIPTPRPSSSAAAAWHPRVSNELEELVPDPQNLTRYSSTRERVSTSIVSQQACNDSNLNRRTA